jgi:hypothetical protein
LIKWNSLQGNASLGGYAEASDPAGIIEYLDHDQGTATLGSPRIAAAQSATHIETPTREVKIINGALTATAAAQALETYLLAPSR